MEGFYEFRSDCTLCHTRHRISDYCHHLLLFQAKNLESLKNMLWHYWSIQGHETAVRAMRSLITDGMRAQYKKDMEYLMQHYQGYSEEQLIAAARKTNPAADEDSYLPKMLMAYRRYGENALLGWDMGRCAYIFQCCYLAGYLNMEEMLDIGMDAGKKAQEFFQNTRNTIDMASKRLENLMKHCSQLFRRDFILFVIAQISSLFGNAILRFALPLYLLRETNSSTLFGIVTACSFLPLIIFSMIGGVMADRIDKRNILIGLDLLTVIIIAGFYTSLDKLPIIPLFTAALMMLYGIFGIYQPAVQASVPLLLPQNNLMAGNAVISQVSSISSLLGPAVGGILFSIGGIYPILILCILCFTFSAIMDFFIRIPQQKLERAECILSVIKNDLKDSYLFIKTEKPVFLSIIALIAIFNLVLSAGIVVGIPIIITQVLKMSDIMYGFTQSALSMGGLFGGILAALIADKINLQNSYLILLACTSALAIMGISLFLSFPAIVSYWVITLMAFSIAGFSTLFTVQVYTIIQTQTPPHFVGKIMAALLSVAMCGQPIGQAIWGVLFDLFSSSTWVVLVGSAFAGLLISLYSKKIFQQLAP